MTRLAMIVCLQHERKPTPSMVMVDAQTVRGARYGPTFHHAGGMGGRTIGTKRTLLWRSWICAWRPTSSPRPHDVQAARELLGERLPSCRGCRQSWATAPVPVSRSSPAAATWRVT
jgi:hypothetical protein